MGREIRRVPKGWEHPQNDQCPHLNGLEWSHMRHTKPTDYRYGKCFKPLYDQDYKTTAQKWIEDLHKWDRGEHPYQDADYTYFWEYEEPPDPELYRPAWKPEEMTCYQIYETVSEGTPVSPVFETLDEMKAWLIEQGYSKKAIEGFINMGSVPSMVYSSNTGLVSGIEIAGIDQEE